MYFSYYGRYNVVHKIIGLQTKKEKKIKLKVYHRQENIEKSLKGLNVLNYFKQMFSLQ